MKKLFFLFAVLSFALISCEKEPFLTLSVQQITSPSSGNSTSITVNSNNPWTVSGNDWCTISPSSGQGGEVSVTVTVKENTTYDARNCTLTFTSEGLMASISVSQETNYGIVLPKNTYEVSSNAQQISVEVKANVEYDITIDADWITQSGTKALTSKSYTFNIAENTSYDGREGNITIKEKNGNNTETIQVKQAQKDAIILSTKEYNISSEAQTLEVKMQTNFDVEVIIPDDAKGWVSYIETKSLVDKIISLDIKANDGQKERICEILFKKKNDILDETLTIRQFSKMSVLLYTTIDEKVLNINSEAFNAKVLSNEYQNGQGRIVFEGVLTKINDEAFTRNDALTSIILPEGLECIGTHSFSYCTSLKSVFIPKTVSSLGMAVFARCPKLEVVVSNAINVPKSDSDVIFDHTHYTIKTLKVPKGSKYLYENSNWRNYFSNIVEIE